MGPSLAPPPARRGYGTGLRGGLLAHQVRQVLFIFVTDRLQQLGVREKIRLAVSRSRDAFRGHIQPLRGELCRNGTRLFSPRSSDSA